jgi:hypothetical protein
MDDFLAILLINGKETYLDPGERMCPFGTLHWKHTLATGFRMTDRDAVLFTTPAGNFKQAEVQRTAFLDIDESGKIDGTVRVAMFGPDALYWRQLALQNDPEEVTKQFNEWIRAYIPAGVEASFDHFLGIDEYTAPLIGVVKVNGSLATMTGKRFFLPGLFFESNAAHPFVALDKRMTPIDVHYPRTDRDQVFYKIPAGYTVESLPQAADISWPGNAVLTIAPAIRQDTVEVVRTLVYNFVLLPAKDYPDLHGFYQKVATADQQQLVLTRTTASKGN